MQLQGETVIGRIQITPIQRCKHGIAWTWIDIQHRILQGHLLAYTQKLGAIRNDSVALREGKRLEMWQDDQIYAFGRVAEGGEAVVVLNNSTDNQTREIPVRPESKIKDGTVLKEVLTGQTVTVENGRIRTQLNGKSAGIYMPL